MTHHRNSGAHGVTRQRDDCGSLESFKPSASPGNPTELIQRTYVLYVQYIPPAPSQQATVIVAKEFLIPALALPRFRCA